MKHTCKTCDWFTPCPNKKYYSWCDEWRPRRAVVFAIIAGISIGIVLLACAIALIIDQARIDATPRAEPVATSWTFGRPAITDKLMVSASTWEVVEPKKARAVTWTIWPNGGYAISEGK